MLTNVVSLLKIPCSLVTEKCVDATSSKLSKDRSMALLYNFSKFVLTTIIQFATFKSNSLFVLNSLHPYTVLFMKKRRARYYKVERAVRGFYVPDWVRKEAEEREMADTVDNIFTWEKFIYQEYMSDMTPMSRWSTLGKLNPLELFTYYGLFDYDSWTRYFYNEAFYEKSC
jgi:hypothetical protein